MHIAIAAGEASGDTIGADLIANLRALNPDARITAVAGPKMRAQSCEEIAPVEELSVMGLVEILGNLPRLLKLRAKLREYWLKDRPDVFVGIDAPEFLLPLEARLKAAQIPVVHYVSPQVWAWREHRARSIARSVDLMLTLFPFETHFYDKHGIPARCVGHPLADSIQQAGDRQSARDALMLDPDKVVLALLPGSRRMEVSQHFELFAQTWTRCRDELPELQGVVAVANESRLSEMQAMLAAHPQYAELKLIPGRTRDVISASDAVLSVSGTATLETMLLGRPMVVAYRMRALSHAVLKRLIRVPHIAMPNLLAGEGLIPEFIQGAAQPEALSQALLPHLFGEADASALLRRFSELGEQLRLGAGRQAADAILELIQSQQTKA